MLQHLPSRTTANPSRYQRTKTKKQVKNSEDRRRCLTIRNARCQTYRGGERSKWRLRSICPRSPQSAASFLSLVCFVPLSLSLSLSPHLAFFPHPAALVCPLDTNANGRGTTLSWTPLLPDPRLASGRRRHLWRLMTSSVFGHADEKWVFPIFFLFPLLPDSREVFCCCLFLGC